MRLRVTVLDVRGQVPGSSIQVTARVRVDQAVGPTGTRDLVLPRKDSRTYEAALPLALESEIEITARSSDFWPATGVVSVSVPLDASLRPMATKRDGPDNAAVTDFEIVREGADRVLVVELRVQKLRLDASLPVSEDTALAWDGEPIVNPFGAGAALLRAREQRARMVPQNFLVARWKAGGIRMGIYIPAAARPRLGHYTYFFKPAPHGMDGLGVIGFYMLGNKGDPMPKHLSAQLELSGAPTVLCMPSPEDGPGLTFKNTQTGMIDLADETDAFLRGRIEGRAAVKAAPRLAMACFSRGMAGVHTVLSSGKNDRFQSSLTSLFLLDGHLSGDATDFTTQVLSWFRGGSQRSVRAYHSYATPLAGLVAGAADALAGLLQRNAALAGVVELHGGPDVAGGFKALSYASFPAAFFKAWDPARSERVDNHQIVPAIFFGHALKTSGIT